MIGPDFLRSAATRLSAGVLLLCVLGIAAPVAGQADTGDEPPADTGGKLPVEFFQGFGAGGGGVVKPYIASLAAIPGYSFESFRLGARVSLEYENPGWGLRFGPRISRQVGHVLRQDIGIILGAEATTDFDWDARLGLGLTFDVDGLIRVGMWGGWDEAGDGGWFGVTFGADPTSWFGCVPSDINPDECFGGQQ